MRWMGLQFRYHMCPVLSSGDLTKQIQSQVPASQHLVFWNPESEFLGKADCCSSSRIIFILKTHFCTYVALSGAARSKCFCIIVYYNLESKLVCGWGGTGYTSPTGTLTDVVTATWRKHLLISKAAPFQTLRARKHQQALSRGCSYLNPHVKPHCLAILAPSRASS